MEHEQKSEFRALKNWIVETIGDRSSIEAMWEYYVLSDALEEMPPEERKVLEEAMDLYHEAGRKALEKWAAVDASTEK